MMKYVGVVLVAAAAVSSQAAVEKPRLWLCEIHDPLWPWPKKSQVEISLQEPLVTRIDWILQDDGSYEEAHEQLITSDSVSKWKARKAECVIRSGFNQGEFVDKYDFVFSCKGVEGSFSLDFDEATGFYTERLTGFNVQRSFSLEKCRSSRR